MTRKQILKAIQFILSHDYLGIHLFYPGIKSGLPLNAKQVLLAITDIDKLCGDIVGKSKKQFIEDDQKEFDQMKMIEKYFGNNTFPEGAINERHRGIRFYPWFREMPEPDDSANPYFRESFQDFKTWDKETQKDFLQLKSRSLNWTELREMIIHYYGPSCFQCNTIDSPSVDHILPRSLYPELELDFMNLVVLCRSCNSKKGNRHIGALKEKVIHKNI